MAERQETRVLNIKVEYAEAIKGIAEYRMKIDELKKSEEELSKQKKAGVLSEEEYQRALAANKIQMKEYNDSIRVLEKEIRNNIKAQTEQEDSLKSLRAKLSNLTAEYDSLSKSERNASKGQGIQKKINDITNELKEAEEATQRYYRNVGNYENSIKDALSVTNNGFTKGNISSPVFNCDPIAAICAGECCFYILYSCKDGIRFVVCVYSF
jgi:predicted  nucleic acid-binding Zn-ribbon protein